MTKFNLYSDILPTKGFTRSLLFDSGRIKIHFIDNQIFNLFNDHDFKNLNLNEIDVLFKELLFDNDLVFQTNDVLNNCFPLINLDWDYSFQLTNAVIHATVDNCTNLSKIHDSFYIAHFNFIIDNNIDLASITILFNFLENHVCDSIELTFIDLLDKKLISKIELNISLSKKIIQFNNYSEIDLGEELIKPNRYFITLEHRNLKLAKNLDHFAESQQHHTYFNRKLYIDINGEIKNAPETFETFGNIKDIKSSIELNKIVKKTEFQKYWFIQKKQTDVCKDCEFRSLCVDNRLPIKRTENEWFHKVECTYNPYICKWYDEEGFLSLEECGVISNEKGFTIDHEKIKKINAILWEEEELEIE